MDTLMALRHAQASRRRGGAGDLQRQRLDHPARGRRGDLHPRRARRSPSPRRRRSSTQLVACYLMALLPGPDARHPPRTRRSPRSSRSLARRPPTWRRSWPPSSRYANSPDSLKNRRCVLFLGRHVGYPVAMEGALKLKELAYMHAEGFAAGELEARPDRPDRGGPAGRRGGPVAEGRTDPARQDRLQHPGDPRPREP